jgi:hypothetical protein
MGAKNEEYYGISFLGGVKNIIGGVGGGGGMLFSDRYLAGKDK